MTEVWKSSKNSDNNLRGGIYIENHNDANIYKKNIKKWVQENRLCWLFWNCDIQIGFIN